MRNKSIYYVLLLLGIAGIFLAGWVLLSNSISQKYELADPEDCISVITGNNLCMRENALTGAAILCAAMVIFCIYKIALDIRKGLA